MRLERTVTTDKPVERVFAYLADFTTTTEWDPGTVETVRVSGDGGPGTRYRNTSKFAGRETELTYTVVEREQNQKIALRGQNKTVKALDTMTFTPTTTGGTEVRYSADFDFGVLTPVLGLLLRPFFTRLGDEAERGMREALERL
ncbi:SRPBCC family protein [Nocardioides mesophilus]|uniref:SRPBCC family protein n=1 Tax=Nocardioides mesophilus TaxID=433659 RepID=A0A7G9RFP0_9ACTN|nr:SRPBCC family protein [Nocardioides mesophilus]QNN54415.1 SRPBCC family protein [Nocardioides mesophilus]